MKDIRNYSLDEFDVIFKGWGETAYRAKQTFSWLYQKRVDSFDLMSNLSLELRKKLKDNFSLNRLKLDRLQESSDTTKKFLFALEDGNLIESVLIPVKERLTACLSSQAGCPFSCGFCASGISGFKRNLEVSEIIGQLLEIYYTLKGLAVTNVVFMGTGEPLDNYENVLKAIRIINAPQGLNIGARRITISTCGIIPGIKRLSAEGLQIELSVSLHASDDKTRTRLMPVNKKYPLEDLIIACKDYAALTKRQVTFEYALIKGLNCSKEAADNLVKLMSDWECKVNLLVYNPVKEFPYQPADEREIEFFVWLLRKKGIVVTLRKSRGKDIDGACGQLREKYLK
ncbi:MAG: 23S rRNA (adenine(2503)-C(2))-methyltransferase RlmN [Candidatus Omnitrophota bacterium]